MADKILLIEDEPRLRRIMEMVLIDAGYEVRGASDGKEGINIWQRWLPDVVVTDLKMAPVDGLEVLKFRNQNAHKAPLIVITAFGTVETAVDAMKDGAFDYLSKPVDNNKLLETVTRALASRSNPEKLKQEMIGDSTAMQGIRQQIALYAESDSAVLITGESGTGKELAARAIHAASPRSSAPFIKKNCAAIPADLIESELFGYKRGAFTGAINDFEGAFGRADGGVLFLDEIGDLPASLQPKLLNVVEEKTITPLGSGKARPLDIKVISATNHDLKQMIMEKSFRDDLYYRLNTLHLHLPTLQEREGDLDLLLSSFLAQFTQAIGRPLLTISPDTLKLLHDWRWPGNIRELSNVIERAVLTAPDGIITPNLLPSKIRQQYKADQLTDSNRSLDLPAQERELITAALNECGGNQTKAAEKLGITRNTLRYRVKKYQLE